MDEITFDGQAPSLHRIGEKVAELSGLTVAIKDSGVDVKGTLFDLHGSVAFACALDEWLELFCYRHGAVRALHDATVGASRMSSETLVQGRHEATGIQAVHLRSGFGLEPTLISVTILALEALGGHPREPITPEMRREYGKPITGTQFEERRRQWRKEMRATTALSVLLLPLLIPVWCAGFLIFLALLPWHIWRAYRFSAQWVESQHRNAATPKQDQPRH